MTEQPAAQTLDEIGLDALEVHVDHRRAIEDAAYLRLVAMAIDRLPAERRGDWIWVICEGADGLSERACCDEEPWYVPPDADGKPQPCVWNRLNALVERHELAGVSASHEIVFEASRPRLRAKGTP